MKQYFFFLPVSRTSQLLNNILAGLSVSFLTLSLGAVFGLISERGVFIGMFSAALMAVITSFLSGTRVQATSPTGPMTATLIAIVAATETIPLSNITQTQFINVVMVLAGIFLILAGLFRLDRCISYVPNIVISGFMTGIAILIFYKELKFIFGWSGTTPLAGSLSFNIILIVFCLIAGFAVAHFFEKHHNYLTDHTPPTLVVILLGCALTYILGWQQHIELVSISSIHIDFNAALQFVQSQFPSTLSLNILWYALPLALKITLIAYLDTLMTALVIEEKTKMTADHQKDLYAQGIATSAIGAIGGIPGAQSTVPSMMLVNEGADSRIATISMGIFCFLGIFLLTDLISLIPQAVFVGIILKIAYDVADPLPYKRFFQGKKVTLGQIIFITIIALLTAFWSLNYAVIGFTSLYIIWQKVFKKPLVRDLKLASETEGYLDEM